MIDLRAEIFTNTQKTGVALTRSRRSGVSTCAKTTSTTINEKSADLGNIRITKKKITGFYSNLFTNRKKDGIYHSKS